MSMDHVHYTWLLGQTVACSTITDHAVLIGLLPYLVKYQEVEFR